MVANRAGVTPSTIYRRWGDLAKTDRRRCGGAAALFGRTGRYHTGSTRGDFEAWIEQYVDETTSEVGRALLPDVFANAQGNHDPGQCCNFTREQLAVIAARAAGGGETPPDVETPPARLGGRAG